MNMLFAVLLNGFTPATPANCFTLVKGMQLNKGNVSVKHEMKQRPAELEIHPLDILTFKFY